LIGNYGTRRNGGNKSPLAPFRGTTPRALPPQKVYNNRSPLCIGCPYPRHGLSCWSKGNEKCLRADMQELEAKWREDRQKKKIV